MGRSQKFTIIKDHICLDFIRRAILPFFAIALITAINATFKLVFFGEDLTIVGDEGLSAEETFAKILNTFNILVIGYTISHLIPIILTKREKSSLEKEDFDAWFELRGFVDDDGDLFHKLYKWVPPKIVPEEIDEEEFQENVKD